MSDESTARGADLTSEHVATERTDYERLLGADYDTSGIDPVFGTRPCPAAHPTTGRPCVYPGGHPDEHWAMGERRMQMFGPNLRSGGGSDA